MTIELDPTKAARSDLITQNRGTAMRESEIVLTSGIERAIEDLAALLAENQAQREQFKLAFGAVLFRLHQPRHGVDPDMEPDSYDRLEVDAERTEVLARCN